MFSMSMLHTSNIDVYKLLLALIILEMMGVSNRRSMTSGCRRFGTEATELGALELFELLDGCSISGGGAARICGSELAPGADNLETLVIAPKYVYKSTTLIILVQ
ncbi:hypothetical protein Aduo_016582 [Ancylostoma duodenale]